MRAAFPMSSPSQQVGQAAEHISNALLAYNRQRRPAGAFDQRTFTRRKGGYAESECTSARAHERTSERSKEKEKVKVKDGQSARGVSEGMRELRV